MTPPSKRRKKSLVGWIPRSKEFYTSMNFDGMWNQVETTVLKKRKDCLDWDDCDPIKVRITIEDIP